MNNFVKPLDTRYIGGGKRKVLTTFGFWTGENAGEGYFILVPGKDTVGEERAFITDFASVPWAARWLIPKDGDYNQGAVLHDFLYWCLGYVYVKLPDGTWEWHQFTRKECDGIFRKAMIVLDESNAEIKIPIWKRESMYRAVRIGGWKGWNRRKKEIAAMDDTTKADFIKLGVITKEASNEKQS